MAELTEEQAAKLGWEDDYVLADRWNVSPAFIKRQRKSRGIRPHKINIMSPGTGRKKWVTDPKVWTPEMNALLGTDTDVALGEKWGIRASAVLRQRAKLGIPSSSGIMPTGRKA